MLITTPTFRNIYTQTGDFAFEIGATLSNLTGECSFGFSGSGDAGLFDFTFRDGKVIYPNKQIVTYYNSGERLDISGFVFPDSGVITVRGKSFNISKTGHKYDYFYVNPLNCTGDFSFLIDGQVPDFSLDSSGCFKSGEAINFDILKSTLYPDFRIFSGTAVFPSGFSITDIDPSDQIASGYPFRVLTTGLIYTTSGDTAYYPLVILFNTNFGDVSKEFTVFKYNDFETRFDIFPSGDITGSGIVMEKNSYESFNIKALYVSPSGFVPVPISIQFNHLSGSGDKTYQYTSTVNITGGRFVSGVIFGSGFVTGLYTGQLPGSGCITGNVPVSGIMSVPAYGGSGLYTVTGFGIGTGVAWGAVSAYETTGLASYFTTVTGTFGADGFVYYGISGVTFTGISNDISAGRDSINFYGPGLNAGTPVKTLALIPRNSLQGRFFLTTLSGVEMQADIGNIRTFWTGIENFGFRSTYPGGEGPSLGVGGNSSGIVAGFSGFRFIDTPVTGSIFWTGLTTILTGVPVFSGTGYLVNSVAQPSLLYTGALKYGIINAGTGITSGTGFSMPASFIVGTYASGFSGTFYLGKTYQGSKNSYPNLVTGYRGTGFITGSSKSGTTGDYFNLSTNVVEAGYWATSGTNTGWVQFDMRSGASNNASYSDISQPTFGCTDYYLQGYVIVSSGMTGSFGAFYTGAAPRTWAVSGSNDGSSWTQIDYRSGVDPSLVLFSSFLNTVEQDRGPVWFPTDTGYYKLLRFCIYETQDPASSQLAINSINLFGNPRIYADTNSGLSDSRGWVCSGIGRQTDGIPVVVTGYNFISGQSFSKFMAINTVLPTGLTGHVPCGTSGGGIQWGFERYPGVPASGFISGSQVLLVSGGKIFGPNIITGQQTFYNRVWRTPVDTGMLFKPYNVVYYSGGSIVAVSNLTYGSGAITGFTSGVLTSLILTGLSAYEFITGQLSGRTAGATQLIGTFVGFNTPAFVTGGKSLVNYSSGGVTLQYFVPFTGVAPSASRTITGTSTGQITLDYWDYPFSGLIINPSGTGIVTTGTDILSPRLVYVSGFDSPFPGYTGTTGTYGPNRWPVLTTGAYISGRGSFQPLGRPNIFSSGILDYYGFFPTGSQTGIALNRFYMIDSGRIMYTGVLDKPYYVGKHSGYSVDPTPLYQPKSFFSGAYGYIESGFLYNTDSSLETRPFTGAWNYYPTGLHDTGDFSSLFNYSYNVSGSSILVRVPLYAIPTGAVSGISGETLTGRYTGLNYPKTSTKPNLTNSLNLTGTLGSGTLSGYQTGSFYDVSMMQNFIGFSTNQVLINASGYVIAEFSGSISVSGQGHVLNSFPNNWRLYSGAIQEVLDPLSFIGGSGISGSAVNFNDQGWSTPSSVYNGPTGGAILGNYTDGFTLAVVYTGSCATGYTAQLIISGLNINSGFIINFSGKDV